VFAFPEWIESRFLDRGMESGEVAGSRRWDAAAVSIAPASGELGYSIESGNVNGGLPALNLTIGITTGRTEFGRPLKVNAPDCYRRRQIRFRLNVQF
jgi:hypothetical protein